MNLETQANIKSFNDDVLLKNTHLLVKEERRLNLEVVERELVKRSPEQAQVEKTRWVSEDRDRPCVKWPSTK